MSLFFFEHVIFLLPFLSGYLYEFLVFATDHSSFYQYNIIMLYYVITGSSMYVYRLIKRN